MTKHNHLCSMAFGKPSPVGYCPRCDELRSGAPARAGWQKLYFASKRERDERWRKALRDHDCKQAGCLAICVFGDN